MKLDGVWNLTCPARNLHIPISIPGDVYTALIENDLLPDPYYSANENIVQWPSEVEWVIERKFEVSSVSSYSAFVLVLEMVDTFTTIYINNQEILKTTSTFKFYRTNIIEYLKEGENEIKVQFHNNKKEASQRYFSQLPKSYPYSENNRVPFMNYIRKPQFQAGWDWGPCICSVGIYQSIQIHPILKNGYDIIEVSTEQTFNDEGSFLKVDVDLHNYNEIEESTKLVVNFDNEEKVVTIQKNSIGEHRYSVKFDTKEKERWTIYEFGKPKLYDLKVTVLDQTVAKKIGIRNLIVDCHEDDYGTTFQFVLNDKVVNARGANFIPIDSIPSRMTKERMLELFQDMVESHMNIVRIWGGGYYFDIVLEICDELGILVWQDFMFGCAQYPNDSVFYEEVADEFHDNILRMKHHASLVLWCGDNEDFHAMNWFPFTKEFKAWLKDEYKKFNTFCKNLCIKYDSSRKWWPSSPCDGTGNYDGDWTSEHSGDLHYWEVWHGGKPFEQFFLVKPRFCSEFGYQSYPSLPVVKTFTPPEQMSIYSESFSNHQKNPSGNMLIKNMFNHYFNEPKNFVQQLYLSQVQQSIAIRQGCEYFRTLKPITRGIIYWQLNDCWPVSSWASIEYGGRWKQLQYHAKRFFDPLMITFFENKDYQAIIDGKKSHDDLIDDQKLKLIVVNDRLITVKFSVKVDWIDFDGKIIQNWNVSSLSALSDTAEAAWQIDSKLFNERRKDGFFYAVLTTDTGEIRSNFYFPTVYKECDLKLAKIKADLQRDIHGTKITLTTDKPAFFVHLESEKVRKFTDSSLVLIPSEKVVVNCQEEINNDDLTIYQLAQIGN